MKRFCVKCSIEPVQLLSRSRSEIGMASIDVGRRRSVFGFSFLIVCWGVGGLYQSVHFHLWSMAAGAACSHWSSGPGGAGIDRIGISLFTCLIADCRTRQHWINPQSRIGFDDSFQTPSATNSWRPRRDADGTRWNPSVRLGCGLYGTRLWRRSRQLDVLYWLKALSTYCMGKNRPRWALVGHFDIVSSFIVAQRVHNASHLIEIRPITVSRPNGPAFPDMLPRIHLHWNTTASWAIFQPSQSAPHSNARNEY